MRKSLIILVFCLGAMGVHGTLFAPVSIKSQIKEGDGVIKGEVITSEAIEENGQILTRVTLRADRWIGVSPEEGSLVDVYYPGGKVGSRVLKIEGTPEFEIGERVILITKHDKEKYWVQNLGLGKFSIKKLGSKEIIINQIFPGMPNVGQMPLNKFYELSKWVKKEKFKERFKDKYELNIEKEQKLRNRKIAGRSIASVPDHVREENRIPTYWLVIILAILFPILGFFRKKGHG